MATKDRNGALHSEENGRFVSKDKVANATFDVEALEKLPRGHLSTIIPGKNMPANVPLDYFGKKNTSANSSNEIPPIPKEAYGFKRDRLSTPHHTRHQAEMGCKDAKEYERKAINFWNRGIGIKYYSTVTRCFCKYRQETEEFLSIDVQGVVRTYFRLPFNKFKSKVYQEKLNEI